MRLGFEKIFLSVAVLMILISCYGLYKSFTQDGRSTSDRHQEVIGSIADPLNSVKRKESGSFEWDSVDSKQGVFYKDTLFVGPDSEVTLLLNNSSQIKLGPNTLLILDYKLSGDKSATNVVELSLFRGSVAVKEAKNPTADTANLQIKMGNGVNINASNKSSFAISKTNNKVALLVENGEVNLGSDKSKNKGKQFLAAKSQPVEAQDIDIDKPEDFEQVKTVTPTADPSGFANAHSAAETPVVRGDLAEVKVESSTESSPLTKDKSYELFQPEKVVTQPPPPNPAPLVPPPPPIRPVAFVPIILETQKFQDYTLQLDTLELKWSSKIDRLKSFTVEISSTASFADPMISFDVDVSEGHFSQTQKRLKFALQLNPIYMIYLPGFLDSLYRKGTVSWRAIPRGERDEPLLKNLETPIQTIAFKLSKSAQISTPAKTKYSPKNDTLTVEWSLKKVLPGTFEIVLAKDSQFKNIFCTKKIVRYSAKKDGEVKQAPARSGGKKIMTLVFSEKQKIEDSPDCKLKDSMKTSKSIYYKIKTEDPVNRSVNYADVSKSKGQFSVR